MKKIVEIIKKSGIFLLEFLTIILLYTTILWIFKLPITKIHIVVEFGITIIFFIGCYFIKNFGIKPKTNKEKIKEFVIEMLVSILISTVVFTLSVYICGKIYDTTSDGNTYHKLAVGSMKNGWIPLYGSCKDYTEEDGNVVTVMDENINYLWADHYAIGTEMIGANIYAFSGNIESGKAFSLVMMYACFAIMIEYLCKNRKINIIAGIIIAFVTVVNPITLTQIGTYYVDTTLAMGLYIIFIELLSITKKRDKENYIILAMAIILCSNSKFTGLAYAGIFCVAFYIYWLIKARKNKEELVKIFKENTIYYAVTVIMTVALVGMSSYLMNTINYKNPFYPLYGKGHVDNMVNQEIPASLSSKSHLEQFLISIFSEGKNVSPAYYPDGGIEPALKIPFTITNQELDNYKIPDIRMGGFGPLYSGIFIITIIISILLIADYIKNKKYNELIQYLLIFGISIVLVIFLDGAYWARYIPYIYFISIMNVIYLFEKQKKWVNVLGYLVAIIIVVNSLLVGKVAISSYISNSRYIKNNLQTFKEYCQAQGEPVEIKLNIIAYQGVLYNVDDLGIRAKVNQELDVERDAFMFKY